MARIAGVNIPTNKRVVIALQYIHGIGPKKASEIMTKVGIPDALPVEGPVADLRIEATIGESDRIHRFAGDEGEESCRFLTQDTSIGWSWPGAV